MADKSKRRWWQFRISTVLLWTLVAALAASWWADRRQLKRRFSEAMNEAEQAREMAVMAREIAEVERMRAEESRLQAEAVLRAQREQGDQTPSPDEGES